MGYDQGPYQRPFRFLDLPLEVRNAIYNVILCTPPPPKLWPLEQQDLVGVPEENCHINHPLETQILRVNRQIHVEAKDSMLRGNQFIRIRGRHASGIGQFVQMVMRWRQVPVLATTASLLASFDGFVMTHLIESAGDAEAPDAAHAMYEHRDGDVDFVILRRDLDVFCETLAFVGIATHKGFDRNTRHFVEIHNPFEDTLSPDFMGEMNQERLLQPYCDHFHGFTSVTVYGHVSPRISENLQKRLATKVSAGPNEALDGVQNAKDLGNSFFRRREFNKAAAAYLIAYSKAQSIANRTSWTKIRMQAGPKFLEAVAEIHYQVCLNAAQNILTCIRETYGTDSYKKALRAAWYVEKAEQSPVLFETEWRPTLAQMAKANFRMASAQRAMGDVQAAKVFIDRARLQAPSDQIIRREAEDIEADARAQAGLGRLLH